jgi:hypothetical protein
VRPRGGGDKMVRRAPAENEARAEQRLERQPPNDSVCDACGRGRVGLVPIESGQRLCVDCIEDMRTAEPTRLAAHKQLRFARALGFEVEPDTPARQLDELLTLHRHVRQYVFDVWREATGESPQDSGVSALEAMHFVTSFVTAQPRLAARIVDMERVRDRQACLERDRLRMRLGESVPVTLAELRPRPLRDRTFELVSARLREQWGSDTCKLGIPSSLIVGRARTPAKRQTKPAQR